MSSILPFKSRAKRLYNATDHNGVTERAVSELTEQENREREEQSQREIEEHLKDLEKRIREQDQREALEQAQREKNKRRELLDMKSTNEIFDRTPGKNLWRFGSETSSQKASEKVQHEIEIFFDRYFPEGWRWDLAVADMFRVRLIEGGKRDYCIKKIQANTSISITNDQLSGDVNLLRINQTLLEGIIADNLNHRPSSSSNKDFDSLLIISKSMNARLPEGFLCECRLKNLRVDMDISYSTKRSFMPRVKQEESQACTFLQQMQKDPEYSNIRVKYPEVIPVKNDRWGYNFHEVANELKEKKEKIEAMIKREKTSLMMLANEVHQLQKKLLTNKVDPLQNTVLTNEADPLQKKLLGNETVPPQKPAADAKEIQDKNKTPAKLENAKEMDYSQNSSLEVLAKSALLDYRLFNLILSFQIKIPLKETVEKTDNKDEANDENSNATVKLDKTSSGKFKKDS